MNVGNSPEQSLVSYLSKLGYPRKDRKFVAAQVQQCLTALFGGKLSTAWRDQVYANDQVKQRIRQCEG